MKTVFGFIGIAVFVLGIIAAMSALVAWIFMLLWNFVCAGVFKFPALTFLQSWALWFLIGMVAKLFRVIIIKNKTK